MDTTYLKSLYVTANCKSISVAAKQLHLSQPGLSFQLQSLESNLGKTLLTRSNKGVKLTPEGKVVFKYAKSIIDLEENLKRELRELDKIKKHLKIGSCSSLADYALPCSTYTFKQIYSDIDINILSMTSYDVLNKLRKNEFNIGIVQSTNDLSDVIEIPIITSNLVLVCGYDNHTPGTTVDELMELPLVIREENAIINESISSQLNKFGKKFEDLNILFSLNSDEAIKRTLIYNEGYAFLPELVVKHEIRDKYLRKIFIKDFDPQCTYSLVYKKDYTLKTFEKVFIDFITSSHRCFCY